MFAGADQALGPGYVVSLQEDWRLVASRRMQAAGRCPRYVHASGECVGEHARGHVLVRAR